jgi:phage terminase small subunit
MPRNGLTPKQAAFVAEYLVDLNATQAAIRAGYSAKNADKIGPRLVGESRVAAAIGEAKAKREAATEVNAAWVLERLRDNVERAMQAEPVYDREGNHTGEYTYQGAVANRALELLGKHHGLFSDRIEHTGAQGGAITVTVTHTVVDPSPNAG